MLDNLDISDNPDISDGPDISDNSDNLNISDNTSRYYSLKLGQNSIQHCHAKHRISAV
jgi:hypothetical protein